MIKITLKNKLAYALIGISFFFFSLSVHAINEGSRYANNSVLANGNWFKIKVASTGMYKLTYEDLKSIGLTNPKNVQIYGYGGEMLEQDFSTTYTDDLPPVSVWMSKDPQNFGPGDYILFYGKGDVKWRYSTARKEFEQTQNPYSFDSYYFVTEANAGPQLISSRTATPSGTKTVSTFQDYYLHEKELVNLSQTGREFFGEDFKTNNDQTFQVSLPGVTTDLATIRYAFAAKPDTKSARIGVSFNDALMKTSVLTLPESTYTIASLVNDYFTRSSTLKEDSKIRFNYTPGSAADQNVRLNFFRINYTRALKPYGAVTPFRITEALASFNFRIAQAPSDILVLDVTDGNKPEKIEGLVNGSSYSFNASNNSIKEYVLIDLSKEIPTPTFAGKVANQNLHSLASADMVIIVQPLFKRYAEELAQLHKDDSNLTTLIVSPEDIYNEFSSGKPDATAYRRFMKMFYDRATTDNQKPKYLLLFGDGSFDNRLQTDEWIKADKRGMLLTYQSPNSTKETDSYTADDYFGFLDDNEGVSLERDKLDIGIGRFPIRTIQEAQNVVQKIKRYMSNEEPGIWQNNVTFVADDAIAGASSSSISERVHMVDTDSFTKILKEDKPELILTKLYEDAFEKKDGPNGSGRYPDARKALLEKVNSGSLILNYVGHGSTSSWAHEYVLTYPDIESMRNTKLPLWITATCDFTRFDASATSGGEMALLNPNGGAIALFTTVRVVYTPNNKVLNNSLFNHLFDTENGKPLRLGDIMRRAKTLDPLLSTDDNKLRFMLLGDPALRLSYPGDKYRVEVNEVNNIDITQSKVQIQALENVTIKGRIVDTQGNPVTDFNGILESIIFDNEQDMKTRGHVNPFHKDPVPSSEAVRLEYKDFTNIIFSGKTNIGNGEFELTFITPKDILYTGGDGKISFYAFDVDGIKDAQGSFTNYTVSGTSPSAVQESNPPVVNKIYLNNDQFKPGDKVNATPTFYAQVTDDTGINLANGIGHNISIIVDGKTSYDLTPTFVNNGTSSKSGSVQYQLPELSEGTHTIQFKVWDVWNNSTTQTISFEVEAAPQPATYKFTITENPAKDHTKFMFTCDAPKSEIGLKYAIYSAKGILQWVQEEKGSANLFSNYSYNWNLKGSDGLRLIPGVYTCEVTININGEDLIETHKLVILGQ